MKLLKLKCMLLLLLTVSQTSLGADCVAPEIFPAGQLFLCDGAIIELSTDATADTYQWFKDGEEISGATASTLDITEAGIYSVTITADDENCTISSEEREVIGIVEGVEMPEVEIISEQGFRFCEGESLELKVQGNFESIVWTGSATTASIIINEPRTYNVGVRLAGGCQLSGSVVVTTYAAPTIEIEASDTLFRPGQSIALAASGANDLTWFPAEGLDNPEIASPTATPTQTMTYYVTGAANNGCRDTTAITLYLDESTINLSPPKLFSPNNDGIDDFWEIENMASYPNCNLIIFNRHGLEVFSARPYQNNWDGTFQGKPLAAGDYYYVMRCGGNKNVKTGSILLVR